MRALAALAALLAVALTVPLSSARFTAQSANPGSGFGAGAASAYFSLVSQSTHPAPVPGNWGVRRLSTPPAPAGTGADFTAAAHLGGWPNNAATYVNQVLVIRTPAAFPAGVAQITLNGARIPDAATGRQPITAGRFTDMNGNGGGATITLGPGQSARLNLEVTTAGATFTTGVTYVPHVRVWATWAGYTDDFYAYTVPVSVFRGSGPG